MISIEQLIALATSKGHVSSPAAAARWLRAVVGLLADWGGPDASQVLRGALPGELFQGEGAAGRSFQATVRHAGKESERVALHVEAAARADEVDPAKVAVSLRPILGLIKQQLTARQIETLAAGLPAPCAQELRAANATPPYPYSLIPQSYDRPVKRTAGH